MYPCLPSNYSKKLDSLVKYLSFPQSNWNVCLLRFAAELRKALTRGRIRKLLAITTVAGSFWLPATAQTGEWNWAGGGSSLQAAQGTYLPVPGVYGTLGVASPANTPGGRTAASTWTDANGNFWLFGGTGADANGTQGYLNDLWKFNASTGEWAWMGGSSSVPGDQLGVPGVYGTLRVGAAGNGPGGRDGALAWVDANGNFWLFGGYGFDSIGTSARELN